MKNTPGYILMLEDDIDDRFTTQSFLDEEGYNIGLQFVTQPEEVMAFLNGCKAERKELPKIILLDMNLPLGSGLDVLKQLKSHIAYQQIPVAIISGSAFPHEVNEAYRLGANSYVLKPLGHAPTANAISTFIKYWFDIVELPQIG